VLLAGRGSHSSRGRSRDASLWRAASGSRRVPSGAGARRRRRRASS